MGKLEPKRTIGQHKVLFGLLNKLNMMHLREDLVLSFSDGRVSSSKDLFESECKRLIDYLKGEVKKKSPKQEKTKLDRMCSKFFFYCHELGWKKQGKLDYKHINSWLLKYGYLKKELKAYTEKEMYKLLQQIEKLVEKKQGK